MAGTELTDWAKRGMEHSPVEAKIAKRLIKTLEAAGDPIIRIFDGDEYTDVEGKNDILNYLFNLDEAYLITESESWVRFIQGNGWDAISDYTVNLESALKPINDWVMSHY